MPINKPKVEPEVTKPPKTPSQSIGTLGEKSLHAGLKEWYKQPKDRLEKMVDGFFIDIVRGNLLIEIQTTNFFSLKNKLRTLIKKHPVRLVYPISKEKWIVRVAADGITQIGRRKSPKKGHVFNLFEEMVSIPSLIKNPNFTMEVLLIREEEIRCDDGLGSWRRKGWSIVDHKFIELVEKYVFKKPADFSSLIPENLSNPFTTNELAQAINQPRWLAQKIAYCLRNMDTITMHGKKGNSILYSFLK
jgi:hypothetical protein